VVDDEQAVRDSLERALGMSGYDITLAQDGEEALKLAGATDFSAIVLDVLMPGVDGLAVCRLLRARGDHTPVLMLTARDAVGERVAGLDAGADDYLIKPFALEELKARLRALVRRSATAEGEILEFAGVTMDTGTREVSRDGRVLELTRMEYALLELFLRNPRQVLTRSVIYERVWGYDFGLGSNSLDVYIGYLRRKMEAADEPRLIHTVRGVGYTLKNLEPARSASAAESQEG
jgi:two-component system response regulator MprA